MKHLGVVLYSEVVSFETTVPVPVVFLLTRSQELANVRLNVCLPSQDKTDISMGKDMWGRVPSFNAIFMKCLKLLAQILFLRVMQGLKLIQKTH